VGFSLSVAPQNRWREVGVGHASRSNSLLVIEANLTRVSQSGLKTGGDVAPSQRLCRRQAEAGRVDAMGCVVPCYPYFVVFLLLGPRGVVVILAFYLGLYILL
jgi:hypothetical protein